MGALGLLYENINSSRIISHWGNSSFTPVVLTKSPKTLPPLSQGKAGDGLVVFEN